MTFILKYRELNRLFKNYYNYLISADEELTSKEKKQLIRELSHINSRIKHIEQMSFKEVRKTCYHSELQAPSKLNRSRST